MAKGGEVGILVTVMLSIHCFTTMTQGAEDVDESNSPFGWGEYHVANGHSTSGKQLVRSADWGNIEKRPFGPIYWGNSGGGLFGSIDRNPWSQKEVKIRPSGPSDRIDIEKKDLDDVDVLENGFGLNYPLGGSQMVDVYKRPFWADLRNWNYPIPEKKSKFLFGKRAQGRIFNFGKRDADDAVMTNEKQMFLLGKREDGDKRKFKFGKREDEKRKFKFGKREVEDVTRTLFGKTNEGNKRKFLFGKREDEEKRKFLFGKRNAQNPKRKFLFGKREGTDNMRADEMMSDLDKQKFLLSKSTTKVSK